MKLITRVGMFIAFGWFVQMVSMLSTGDTAKESDGDAVNVDLNYTVAKDDICYVDGWLGVAADDGDSGDTIALDISEVERQVVVPAALNPAKGSIIYIDVTDLTGHIPDDTAYGTSAGANKVAFMRTTSTKDASNVLTAIFLKGGLLS